MHDQSASESTQRPPNRSELPLVTMSYGKPAREWSYEGAYPDADALPFDMTDAMGIKFEMDNIRFAIDGDLGGQAVYHRVRDPSTLYHMPWTTFAESYQFGTITLDE